MGDQLGKYRLLKKLASGGMGEIWLARQQGLAGFDRLAVVKKILEHLSKSRKFVEMFLDEARLAAQLSHPHIVQIFDLGKDGDIYYIAMEYVHGENLRMVNRTASRSGRPAPPPIVARVISQACEALHYAHTRTDDTGTPLGIVHRDVSPQNLLLSYEGQIKVVDFGIAKAVGRMTETKTGDLKGKTVYMSPEQIRGGVIDARTDVFAMGIVLWELVTGRRLYNQETDFLVMQAICDEPPPSPREVRRDVPEELEEVVLTALQKKPQDRFQSANEMHMALERYLQRNAHIVSSTHLAKFMRDLFPD
ncbi:MAG: serine/threonine protein kinase, partial [Myxococcota bacterium]